MKRVLFAVMALLLVVGAWAAKPNEADAKRLRGEVDAITKQAAQVQAAADKATGDLKTDALAFVDALKAKAAASSKLAEAKASGEDAALATANDEFAKANLAAARAQDRYTVRQNVSQLQPTDATIANWRKTANDTVKPYVEMVATAREKAITAGNALAAGITVTAKGEEIETLRDAWLAAQDALEIANKTCTSTQTREAMKAKAGNNPDLLAKIEALAKADADYLAALKLAKEQALALHILERKRMATARETEAAVNAAAATKPAKPGSLNPPKK